WPAVSRMRIGLPSVHLDDVVLEIELQCSNEPMRKLTQGESMAHRQRTRADEAFPARSKTQTFDRSPDGIRPVEHPDCFLVRSSRFQHVAKCRDEGVDATSQILQIDEQDVERLHHRI